MDNLFSKPKRRHVRELNVVPILDMMTTLIIFLLQITSFMEYTKITIPPSTTATITDPLRPPPVSPKLLLMRKAGSGTLRIQMTWTGEKAGVLFEEIASDKLKTFEESTEVVLKSVIKLGREFNLQFPSEKTFQVGATSQIPYQYLVSTMDGLQMSFRAPGSSAQVLATSDLANIVLISYEDVDAEVARAGTF